MLVAHACNTTRWEAEIGKIMAGDQPRQLVNETPSPK
jgi:hypothetical protein